MGSLTKQQIIDADDLSYQEVAVPEWGEDGVVLVHVLPSGVINKFSAEIEALEESGSREHLDDFHARLSAMCLRDEDGNRLFTDDEVSSLAAKNSQVIKRIFDVALSINGMQPKSVEQSVGNSDADQGTDLDSNSHSPLVGQLSG